MEKKPNNMCKSFDLLLKQLRAVRINQKQLNVYLDGQN